LISPVVIGNWLIFGAEHAFTAPTLRAHRETTPIPRSVVAISGRRSAEIANDFYF
jgi:hypothetical protein